MDILGTKKFWIPAQGASKTQKENQIIRNSGYISIQLFSANYMSTGSFWQKMFGGTDKISLSTTLSYQTGTKSVDATTVQDTRSIKSAKDCNLGIQRNIVVKVPANSNAIALNVKVLAVKDDNLQSKFDMLNQPEFKPALQLAPIALGQILTVSSLVKKLFTDAGAESQIDADYAGIISASSEDNPIDKGRLTQGWLLIISTNDGLSFSNVDQTKFELRGDTLYYNKTPVINTYCVFNISFDEYRGDDETSPWFQKYADAISNLDKIQFANGDAGTIQKIYTDTQNKLWEGNGLIEADVNYTYSEQMKIRSTVLNAIIQKYNDLVKPKPGATIALNLTNHMLRGVAGSSLFSYQHLKKSLPNLATYLDENFKISPKKSLNEVWDKSMLIDSKDTLKILKKDSDDYLKALSKNKIPFKLLNLKKK